ncbi:MAG: DNA polymerase III subunit gamma/tau [Candidatus Latescibacteria bacterium]|nr:DNA polymerase III subunit gamma/tau [bacterium]MBD3423834.1 DNA polymerase III subunit gamma/tau [Candidatus Latescibacterota bacterium]
MPRARPFSTLEAGEITMSYLILARKWRPQKFSEIVGQDHVSTTLSRAVEKGRVAHAYLFSGPRGCGKTSTARILAKVINCENRSGGEPCGSCESCQAVAAGEHMDVMEIDGASNRGIDEIRDLREKIGYTSTSGMSKIYIIDEVHMLTPQAFNALLKTLEEPPAHVFMILATTEPNRVPATIRSRCQRFSFKRLEFSEIVGQLEKICTSEKIDYRKDALQLIARRSDGSMRDAESLLDQSISASEKVIDIELVRSVLGLVDSAMVSELLRAVSGRNRSEALSIVNRAVSSGLDLEEFFLAYMEGLRSLLVISVGGEGAAGWLDLTDSEFEEFSGIADTFRVEDLLLLFRSAVRSFDEFRRTAQQRYHLEALVAEAASWDSAVDISELIGRIDSGDTGGDGGGGSGPAAGSREAGKKSAGGKKSRKSGSGPQSSTSKAEAVRVKPETRSGERAGNTKALAALGGREEWEKFLSKIREAKLTLGIWLMSAKVMQVIDDKIVLGFDGRNRFACGMVREAKNRRYIEKHLEDCFGKKFTIDVVETDKPGSGDDDRESKDEKPAKKNVDPEIDKMLKGNPMARRLVEEFDGEIIPEKDKKRRA